MATAFISHEEREFYLVSFVYFVRFVVRNILLPYDQRSFSIKRKLITISDLVEKVARLL